MTIALIGPSGAGKGTHADILVANFNLLHVSTGDLFRHSLENHTALGILARKYMDEGELVPDEVVAAMMDEWLWKVPPDRGILFDGFPRTQYQANFLDQVFQKIGRKTLEAVIYLKVPDEEVIKRLPGRILCRNCQRPYHIEFRPPAIENTCDRCRGELYQRTDDNPDIVQNRIRRFHRVTERLVEYYQDRDRLVIVDGTGTIDQVSQSLVEAVHAIQKKEADRATKAEIGVIQALKQVTPTLSIEQTTHASLDLVLLGAPGSGKGTQAEQLKTLFNLPHISTGDIFRKNITEETELGQVAKSYMNRGELVPDDITEGMVQDRLAEPDADQGFILDGFPRTYPQAEALTDMMTGLERRLDAVLYIKVSDEEIVERLSGRLVCKGCQTSYHVKYNPPAQEGVCDACGKSLYQRDDDNVITVQTRLDTFHAQTAPLIDYYKKEGLLIEIQGEDEIETITAKTVAIVEQLRQTIENATKA